MQLFSCEFCEVLKNIYFAEHLRTAASESCRDFVKKRGKTYSNAKSRKTNISIERYAFKT